MKKKYKWPKRSDIEKFLKKIDENPELVSLGLAPDDSLVDQIKYKICAELIIYQRENEINQRELAQRLEISEALVSKMLRYRFSEFTLDRLIRYMEILGIKFEMRRIA